MKKLLSVVLAVFMLATLSVSVMAAEINQDTTPKTGDTAISFNVDPAYTVTIPATITLEKETNGDVITYETDLTVSAEAGVRLVENTSIVVKLAGDFELSTTAGSTLPYTVTVNDVPVANNGTVATFTTTTGAQSSVLHLAANNPTYAGNYTDTVTFTVSVQ